MQFDNGVKISDALTDMVNDSGDLIYFNGNDELPTIPLRRPV